MRIICWDLDGTILNTDRLFAPVDTRVAEVAEVDRGEAYRVRREVSRQGFTFHAWFAALNMSAIRINPLIWELEADLASRAPRCIYQGVRSVIESTPARHVLVTAGDSRFQRWKFDLLALNACFAEADRHFVPRTGSKAQVIAPYLSAGAVRFVENLPEWHQEVLAQGLAVRLIRPRWPEVASSSIHEGDGTLWEAVDTPEQLRSALRR